MLRRSMSTGITTLANPSGNDTATHEIVAELAAISTRIIDIERMLDRALFTACAYCYARSAAQGARKSDEAITTEIKAAYDRQRRLSQEDRGSIAFSVQNTKGPKWGPRFL